MKASEFESIFKAISIPCIVLLHRKNEFLIVDCNEAYLKITHSDREDLLGKASTEAFPRNPDLDYYGADILLDSFRKVASQKRTERIEGLRYDIPVRDSKNFLEKYWSLENIPVLDEQGGLAYVLHMVQDITPRIHAERKVNKTRLELEKIQQQFHHFVDSNPDGLYSMDRDGNFLHVNEGLAQIAEISVEEMQKMNFLPFCHPDDKALILQHFELAIGGKANKFEARFVSAVGNLLFLNISLAPIQVNGGIVGAYGIAKDLTPLKEIQTGFVQKMNFLQANTTFIHGLVQNEVQEKSLQDSLAVIGEAVDVDRISYFFARPEAVTGNSLLNLKLEWTSKTIHPQIHHPEFHNFPVSKLEKIIGKLNKKKPFSTNLSDLSEGELKDYLLALNTFSILLLPIFINRQLYGLISFNDCRKERQWTDEEIDFLNTLAINLTSTLEKHDVKAALLEQEEALLRNEKKFKALVQEGSDLIAIIDVDGNYKFVSDTSTHILEITPEEFLGRNAFDFIHPEDRDRIQSQFESLDKIKRFKLDSYRFKDGDGKWRWLETTITNLSEDPIVQGVVANSRDITRMVDQEQEIKQLNERYTLAANATQDLIYDWDLKSNRIVRFNKNFSDFLGHPIEMLNQQSFWRDNIHPEEAKAVLEMQQELLANQNRNFMNAEYRFRRADGSYAYFIDRAYIIRNTAGEAVRIVGATADISALRSKAEDLRIANKRFKLAMKATKEMLWDWDIEKGETIRSKAFKTITGYDMKSNFSQPDFWFTKLHPKDKEKVQDSLHRALNEPTQRKWKQEYRLLKPDGEKVYITDRGFIVRSPSGKAIRMVGSALDVTESRRTMKRIKQQNKLLQEIAWDQSHLVRAPLVRIKGLLHLIEMQDFEHLSQEETLRHLHGSADEMDRIIRATVKKTENLDLSASAKNTTSQKDN